MTRALRWFPLLAIISGLLTALQAHSAPPVDLALVLSTTVLVLALVGSLPALLWRWGWPWRSVRVRYAWWHVAGVFGRLGGLFQAGWRKGVFLYLVVSIILIVFSKVVYGNSLMLAQFFNLDDAQPSSPWLQAAVVAIIAALASAAYSARQRVTILAFHDYTGDNKDLHSTVVGLPSRLFTALSHIRDLHQVMHAGPFDIAESGFRDETGSPSPNIDVGGSGESFKELASSDSVVKFGPLSVPIGAVLGALSGLVRGPQIAGSVHRVGEHLRLEATLRHGEHERVWSVSLSEMTDTAHEALEGEEEFTPDDTELVDRLVRQLAYRIFTDIERERLGSPVWQAVVPFTNGLDAVRDARRDRDRSQVYLRSAEQQFARAFSKDPRFALSLYNLGVVHYRLGHYVPAYATIAKALAIRPELIEARYALAKAARGLKDFVLAERHCDDVLALAPSNPTALNLSGVLGNLRQGTFDVKIAEQFAQATVHSWRTI